MSFGRMSKLSTRQQSRLSVVSEKIDSHAAAVLYREVARRYRAIFIPLTVYMIEIESKRNVQIHLFNGDRQN